MRRFAATIRGGLDVDYKAVLAFAESEGITLPNETQQEIDSDLLKSYKSKGLWVIDDVFFKFKGDYPDNRFRLIDWKRLIEATPFGALVYSNNGIKGNAVDAYVDTLFNPATDSNNFTLNNNAVTHFEFNLGTFDAVPRFKYGVISLTPTVSQIGVANYRGGGDRVYNSNGVATRLQDYAELGINILDRINSSDVRYITSVSNTVDHPSDYIPNYNMYLLARNRENVTQFYSDGGLSYFTMGASRRDKITEIKDILI